MSSSDDSLHEGDPASGTVRVSVWACGRVWRYGAMGHALLPLRLAADHAPKPVVVGLYHQLEVTLKLDLEIAWYLEY